MDIQMQILRANPFVSELDSYRASNAIYFFVYLKFDFRGAKSCSFRNPSETLLWKNEIVQHLDNAFLGIVAPSSHNTCKVESRTSEIESGLSLNELIENALLF